LPFPYTVAVAVAVAYLFAAYGCSGTEFSYVIFTEQRNFTTAERRNGNGRTATEWWKAGIMFLGLGLGLEAHRSGIVVCWL